MLEVSVPGGTIDEYIIKEDSHKPSQERPEKIIHGGLESRGGIRQPERHHRELIMALMCAKSGFWYIVLMHANLVKALPEIKLQKPGSPADFVQ